MLADAPRNLRQRQVDASVPNLAAFMMARAMAEMFQDEPSRPLPLALAAILQQMKRWVR